MTVEEKRMLDRIEKSVIVSSDTAEASDAVEQLKGRFLLALHEVARGINSLRTVVIQCMDADVDRDEMLNWAVEAGYSEGYVRSLLSQILIAEGHRRRKSGAGPKPPMEAQELAEIAVQSFRKDAAKILLAAYRLVKGGRVHGQPRLGQIRRGYVGRRSGVRGEKPTAVGLAA